MTEPPKKKRKLPSLDAAFSAPPRVSDSPELHQGRTRSVPHAQGQWASHVYLELIPSDELRKTLEKALKLATPSPTETEEQKAAVHSLLPVSAVASKEKTVKEQPPLHLSLSRPLILQTNQRAELRAALAKLTAQTKSFSARYATFAWLENDDKTRRFLGIEIGQGYDAMKDFVALLNTSLSTLRLPPYYDNPRFHTSIAWSNHTSATSSHISSPPPFDEAQLADLERKLGKALREEELWVGQVCVKIGQQVTRYTFVG
ncbi:U6 snRNA phosphodiesterase Usb1 [Leucosporidium creatinivorum]|uniref:U6 snRNA phosphodiesterase 1 n=1 Tax=Leucosporidium creatinivorum TaxID=106004 RepID=A0A1Y2EB24_9BASI|nr:U6 snRNA phosphodiesterase Usb1 [Leucosporidium creatinivorum]